MESFEFKYPRVAFLSGCRTGQAGDEGQVGSMAETLVRQGIPAVLGWGRPVLDSTGTMAAAHLYQRLAEGYPIAQGLASTYRRLRKEKTPDWHLLRLYARSQAWGRVTESPEEYIPFREPVQAQFLDAENKVRVATAEEFVGQRRLLQRCLRQLRSRKYLGILLHGLGGVGKSTVAARLLERLSGYTPMVIYRYFDTQKLERLLREQCLSEKGQEILNSKLPLTQRLTLFLQDGLNQEEQKFCFVLDDFEANLEATSDGQQVLQPKVVEPLMSLLKAVAGSSAMGHRFLITSRYDVTFPELDSRLEREPVAALRGADLQKKCQRLEAFQRQSAVNIELKKQAQSIADGNPRLLEWLDIVLREPELDKDKILNRMAAEEKRFRESILAEELLKQQSEELVKMLSSGRVFELPVPEEAISAVCTDIGEWKQHLQRAVTLGLLEASQFRGQTSYRVPQILAGLLPSIERPEVFQTAAEVLDRLWWQTKKANEEQCLEIYRLAKVAGKKEIVIDISADLGRQWQEQGRYRDAIPLYETNLEMTRKLLGEDHPAVATSLNNLALLYKDQGRYEAAEPLLIQALELIRKLLGEDHPAVATSLNNLAALYNDQGRYDEAEPLYLQALEICERVLGVNHPNTQTIRQNLQMMKQT